MLNSLQLRPITATDTDTLFSIYASTRLDELQPTGWSDAEKQCFLLQQFDAQHRYYQDIYAGARFDLVIAHGAVAGRLYVARWPAEIRIIDIALLPSFRRQGIGATLLQQLLDEGDQAGQRISIHVEISNPARRLYEKLGFSKAEDLGLYWRMEREPRALPCPDIA